jgi:hypothetical protein
MIDAFTDEQVAAFDRDGFLILEEGFATDAAINALRERFDHLFAGEYPTGIRPDEVNWVAGRDPATPGRPTRSSPRRCSASARAGWPRS